MSFLRGWVWHNWVALCLLGGTGWIAARELSPAQASTGRTGETRPLGASRGGDAFPAATSRDLPPDYAELHRRVLRAAAGDPFRPERQRVGGRYHTPAERVALEASRPPLMEPPSVPSPGVRLAVRGIAADGRGRTIVAVEIDGQTRLMRVGEEFGGYRLLSAGSGQARFRGPDGVRTVRLGA